MAARRSSQPSILDIAARAGVSKSTAARALHGGSVSDDARARVLAAARALRYRTNAAAQALRQGGSRILALVVPAGGTVGAISSVLQAQKVEGLTRAAAGRGFDLQMHVADLGDAEALRSLVTDRFVRGFFFLGPVGDAVLDELERYRIPWVGVNWRRGGPGRACGVWTDFRHAGRTLIDHLAARGCRRVLAFDWLSASGYGPFGDGIRGGWSAAGLPAAGLELHVGGEYFDAASVAPVLEAAVRRRPPDGIVFGVDRVAAACYPLLRRHGLVPGTDLRVVAFDDLEAARHLDPPLTAYAQPGVAMGERAVAIIERQLVARAPKVVHEELPGALVVRASSGD